MIGSVVREIRMLRSEEGPTGAIRWVYSPCLDTVFLASPTSEEKRLQHVDEQSSGFVYYVSRTGVTGMQSELSQSLGQEMGLVKRFVKKPVMVGFGISNPEQAVAAAQLGDGIIIGSAIVKIIEDAADAPSRLRAVRQFASGIRAALDRAFPG